MNILCTTSNFHEKIPLDPEFKVIFNPFRRKLTESEIIDLLTEYDPVGMIAGVEPLNKGVLQHGKSLKILSRCGIGMDTVDLQAAEELGIIVTNTPDAPTIPVAELTIGLILNLLRGVCLSDRGIRTGDWKRPMGQLLNKKIIGIVGYGRIGGYISKLLHAFGCHILVYDPYVRSCEVGKIVSFDYMLAHSDIITLHLPYSSENHHLIGKKEMDRMKESALLINTSRGGLVDEEALYEGLVTKKIAGAAIDCYEEEPYCGKLRELDNILLSGHIGSYAEESRKMQEKHSVENLISGLIKIGLHQK